MEKGYAILIIKWDVPACVLVVNNDGKIARSEFSTRREALEFCKSSSITIQEIVGKGWNEFGKGC